MKKLVKKIESVDEPSSSNFSFTQLLMNGAPGSWGELLLDQESPAPTTSGSAIIPAVLLQSDFEVNPSNAGENIIENPVVSIENNNNSSKSKKRRPSRDSSGAAAKDESKKQKTSGRGKDHQKQRAEIQALSESENTSCKPGKENSKPDGDGEKLDYIHVRARRGQATDSHSLAERVRREKISERMKLLQDLVPGCNKVTGKAMMLDEIINYVQSLQRQVEFLSMKLAAVKPVISFYPDSFLTNETPGALHETNCLLHEPLHQAWHSTHPAPVES